MLVYDRPQEVADWVATQSGTAPAPRAKAAIGYEVDGQFRAGVYFDGYTKGNIFAHIASSANVIPPALLMAVAKYVYVQLGLSRMTFPVSSANFRTRDFVSGMGAVVEGVLKEGADHGTDLVLFVLWKHDSFPQRLLTRGGA